MLVTALSELLPVLQAPWLPSCGAGSGEGGHTCPDENCSGDLDFGILHILNLQLAI